MRTETITKEIFTFDELPGDAKEKARDWWRDGALDYEWYDAVYDDAERVAEILGIEFYRKRGKNPTIWFSGFSSQGDGACFEGSYSYSKGAAKRIREYAPKDKTLHSIADELQRVQKRYFYQLNAACHHAGYYYHARCMAVSVEHNDGWWRNVEHNDDCAIVDALREFADWIYSQLESEYNYLMSDDCVDEQIRANECEFDATGMHH